MRRRLLKILGFMTLWGVILAVLVLLTLTGQSRREAQRISSVEIAVADSTASGSLITRSMIQQMLDSEQIALEGVRVRDIDLSNIERIIGGNGFVAEVVSYLDYSGCMTLEIKQRTALARLLLDGYNCYITHDGYIFDAPSTTALYTPVVTGGYRPLFERGYTGFVEDRKRVLIEELDQKILRVEREKYPIYLRERENTEERRSIYRRFINQSMFESDEAFDKRVEELRADNRARRERCAAVQRSIDKELKALEQRQEGYRKEQKKLEKKCEDIYNLLNFVESLETDPFWSSEVVQIALESGEGQGADDMRIRLAVRSGKFTVVLGAMSSDRTEMKSRLTRLREFYKEALPRVGWERYREINIEYENQVICRK